MKKGENVIEEILKEIKNNKKCSGCGASKYDNCKCIYCERINDKLRILTGTPVSALKNTNNFDDKTLVNLFSISDLGIEEVNSILNSYNVYNILNNKYKWLIDNKFGNSIAKSDAELFISIINSNVITDDNKNIIIFILMRYMIIRD